MLVSLVGNSVLRADKLSGTSKSLLRSISFMIAPRFGEGTLLFSHYSSKMSILATVQWRQWKHWSISPMRSSWESWTILPGKGLRCRILSMCVNKWRKSAKATESSCFQWFRARDNRQKLKQEEIPFKHKIFFFPSVQETKNLHSLPREFMGSPCLTIFKSHLGIP